MVLKFKQRGVNDLKKVLVYGADGSGKSTFAENYCNENNLSPAVIDIDDTNYTNLPIVDLDLSSDMVAFRGIIKTIKEISKTPNFDTIILDGVTSLLEILTTKAKGIKRYADRAERFNAILNELLSSGKNIIFIGQIDMKVIHNEEFQSPKPIVKINSIVNEKYLCIKEKNNFKRDI
jgi:GTPase SAR1 family protein